MQHVAQFIIEHRLLAFRRGSGRGGRGDGCGDRSRGLGRRFRLGDGFAFLSEQIEGPGLIFPASFSCAGRWVDLPVPGAELWVLATTGGDTGCPEAGAAGRGAAAACGAAAEPLTRFWSARKTCRQEPQRTWPPRAASCASVILNTLLQKGQRVCLVSLIFPQAPGYWYAKWSGLFQSLAG